jgi:hypothetical protein
MAVQRTARGGLWVGHWLARQLTSATPSASAPAPPTTLRSGVRAGHVPRLARRHHVGSSVVPTCSVVAYHDINRNILDGKRSAQGCPGQRRGRPTAWPP